MEKTFIGLCVFLGILSNILVFESFCFIWHDVHRLDININEMLAFISGDKNGISFIHSPNSF